MTDEQEYLIGDQGLVEFEIRDDSLVVKAKFSKDCVVLPLRTAQILCAQLNRALTDVGATWPAGTMQIRSGPVPGQGVYIEICDIAEPAEGASMILFPDHARDISKNLAADADASERPAVPS